MMELHAPSQLDEVKLNLPADEQEAWTGRVADILIILRGYACPVSSP
jgi:hypothetical protein